MMQRSYSHTSYNVVQIQPCMRQSCTNHILSDLYNVINIVKGTTLEGFCSELLIRFSYYVHLAYTVTAKSLIFTGFEPRISRVWVVCPTAWPGLLPLLTNDILIIIHWRTKTKIKISFAFVNLSSLDDSTLHETIKYKKRHRPKETQKNNICILFSIRSNRNWSIYRLNSDPLFSTSEHQTLTVCSN